MNLLECVRTILLSLMSLSELKSQMENANKICATEKLTLKKEIAKLKRRNSRIDVTPGCSGKDQENYRMQLTINRLNLTMTSMESVNKILIEENESLTKGLTCGTTNNVR